MVRTSRSVAGKRPGSRRSRTCSRTSVVTQVIATGIALAGLGMRLARIGDEALNISTQVRRLYRESSE